MGAPLDIPFFGPHTEDDLRLFGPYHRLVAIRVGAEALWVPEDNSVLRCLQFVAVKTSAVRLPWHTFCWNNREGCCVFRFRAGEGGAVREARACVTMARPGLEIIELPKGGVLCSPAP